MDKLKTLISKYGFYIGVALVIIIVILLIVFGNFKKEEKPVIEAPFTSESGVRYTMRNSFPDFSDSVPVYRAETFSEAEVIELFKNVGLDELERSQTTDSTVIWEKENKRAVWSIEDGILNISTPDGLALDIEKEATLDEDYAEEYVLKFSKEYLSELPNFDISEISENEESYTINAQYQVKDINIASSRLNGYSISVKFSEFGELEKMSVLLIKEISYIRDYPSIEFELVSSYANNDNFPSSVSYEVIDSKYRELPVSLRVSSELKDIYIEDSEKIWIFVDNDYKYIVPVYRMSGEGVVEDTQEEVYKADATVMFCVIDPSYLKKKEVSDEPVESPEENILNNEEVEYEEVEEEFLFDPVGTSQ